MVELPEIMLVGITARTNNAAEMDPTTAQIGATLQSYFYGDIPNKIYHRKTPGITYCIYTEYESDFTGNYTYFIGEEVTSFENLPDKCTTLSIPAQKYVKFTTESGQMPDICIQEWVKIWQLSDDKLGGKRSYIADFERYDERATDPQNTALDIFIGIQK